MISMILFLFMGKHKQVKHLLRKQKEIRLLDNEIYQLRTRIAKLRGVIHEINKVVKEEEHHDSIWC